MSTGVLKLSAAIIVYIELGIHENIQNKIVKTENYIFAIENLYIPFND